jgi:Ca2+/Na+ antiporter
MREINLINGINVCIKRNENTPRIALSMNFSIVKPELKAGQYLLMNRLLMKGTEKYSSEELSTVLDENAIELYTEMKYDYLRFRFVALNEDFEFALSILSDIVLNSTFEEFEKEKNTEEIKEEVKEKGKWSTLKDICAIILGVVALKFGGDLAVDNAVKVATILGLSEKIISVTILAIGTSLPELVTSVSAAIKGKSDIAIGNILGSNIFNMLLIIGLSSVINPMVVSSFALMDILFVSMVMLFFIRITFKSKTLSKIKGIPMIMIYAAYIIFTIIR